MVFTMKVSFYPLLFAVPGLNGPSGVEESRKSGFQFFFRPTSEKGQDV